MVTKRSENRIVFLGWDGFDQRNEGYCRILDATPVYVGRHHPNRLVAMLAWVPKTVSTIGMLIRRRPSILMIKNTHWVIAMVAVLLRPFFGYKLVLDSHSCAFDGGLVYPHYLHRLLCRKASLSLVTNDADRAQIETWGGRVHVIPFPPVDLKSEPRESVKLREGFNICFAHTYAIDEPYREVIEAVGMVSGVNLYVTGNTAKANHPLTDKDNVVHTGFISRARYLGLIADCDCVMTLTTRDNTMQKAGNEAIFTGTPLITSRLPFLETYFQAGTVFVDLEPASIAAGIRCMMGKQAKYRVEMETFAHELQKTNRERVQRIVPLVMNSEDQT